MQAALTLLEALCLQGLKQLVLCPGSRSGPLATAAGMLASAMMTGYFLRQMEQRKELEETLFADEQMAIEPEDELKL